MQFVFGFPVFIVLEIGISVAVVDIRKSGAQEQVVIVFGLRPYRSIYIVIVLVQVKISYGNMIQCVSKAPDKAVLSYPV